MQEKIGRGVNGNDFGLEGLSKPIKTMTTMSSSRPLFEYFHANTKYSSGLSPEALFTINVPNFNG